jgi:ATP-dependent exoDNAse (exonuclease V) beta subunit
VAVTRAKNRLHLTYTVSIGENIKQIDEMKPSKSTLLTALFGQDCYKERLKNHPFLSCKSYDFRSIANDNSNDRNSQKLLVALNRIPASWEKTLSFNKIKIPKSIANIVTSDEKKTSSIIATSARHTGTVLHRILNQIVIDGINKWDEKKIIDQIPHWQSQLQGLGLTNYDQPLSLLQRSVDACIRDKKNHWIFDSSHKDSKCEYRIGYKSLKGKQSKTSIIDRCFILNGTQWIIDYKSSEPSKDQSRDIFLNQEVAEYEKKLRHYEKILHDINNLPTKTGLYFPLIQHLEIV